MTVAHLEHSVGPSIYGADQIAAAIARLADEIAADHRGQPLVLIGVLKGRCALRRTSRGSSPAGRTVPVRCS